MKKIDIKIKIKDGVEIPKYMSCEAAGMDVYAFLDDSVIIKPMERVLIPTGIISEIPVGYEIQVRPRSGLALKHGLTLINTPGTIDSDFRGEIKIIMINLGTEEYRVNPGDRIAQFVVNEVFRANLNVSDDLGETKRLDGGFGHTGKK